MIGFLFMLAYSRSYVHYLFIVFSSATLCMAIIISSGCARKGLVSQEALRIRKIKDFVEHVEDLYEKGDIGIISLFSQDYMKEHPTLKDDIKEDFFLFTSISLDMFISRIEEKGEDLEVTIHWKGTWTKDENAYPNGGTMVMIIPADHNIFIKDMAGKSPFGISRLIQDMSNGED